MHLNLQIFNLFNVTVSVCEYFGHITCMKRKVYVYLSKGKSNLMACDATSVLCIRPSITPDHNIMMWSDTRFLS